MNNQEVDDYIRQTLYGILPEEFWLSRKGEKKDPFENLSPEEVRIAKRKFRKLKRTLKIKRHRSAKSMWGDINYFLRTKVK
jgi:hypothetical protein|tara:strand:- start:236 stop:478 length:243 start_codon:yes stop_codon:yes gene_type:complete